MSDTSLLVIPGRRGMPFCSSTLDFRKGGDDAEQ